MTDPAPTPDPTPTPEPAKDAFTQEDVDRIVADRLKREREATKTKYADYDDLKKAAGDKKTAEDRIADLEQEVQTSKVAALRASYSADVPEKLRPLLTGNTDEELKAQRDLILDGEKDRKRNGNSSPREGTNPSPTPGDEESRSFARNLFKSGE